MMPSKEEAKKQGTVLYTLKNIRSIVNDRNVYHSTFIQQEYAWLWLRLRPGTIVLDIGSAKGDTAIYFAMNPLVDRVISYEISKPIYEIAKKNISESGLEDKIELLNVDARLAMNQLKQKNIAIKCDIEGAEYELFLKTKLDNVYAIQMEFHKGIQNLQELLEANGFSVLVQDDPEYRCMIYAERTSL